MAKVCIPHDEPEVEDDEFEHEHRIVDRFLDGIAPDELPDDVDAYAVAYFVWCRLTSILFVCGWKPEELAKEVHETALSDAEPEGAA